MQNLHSQVGGRRALEALDPEASFSRVLKVAWGLGRLGGRRPVAVLCFGLLAGCWGLMGHGGKWRLLGGGWFIQRLRIFKAAKRRSASAHNREEAEVSASRIV